FHAEGTDLFVLLIGKDDIDLLDVGMGGNVIFGEIMVHDATDTVVHEGLLVKRHADTHHNAAENLAACGLRVEDSARGHCTYDPRYSDDGELFIDTRLGKNGRMRIACEF